MHLPINFEDLLRRTVVESDRINYQASLGHIKVPLIQSFLLEVKSGLLEESRNLSLEALCRQMAIVDGGDEYLKPRNVGLLFFNERPEQFFPYAQIDVVYFPNDEGGDQIQEEIFKGPLDHQLHSALRYIRNCFITERIIKFSDRAKAKRFFNYSYEAIKEALVNAVYHRSYEIREPIEVRINRTSISVVSHPGPDPSIPLKNVESRQMQSRRYRNRRIGDFLKELEFMEGRGTGIPKMRRALQKNGSPEPVFYTDNARLSFWIKFGIHPEFLDDHGPQKVQVVVHDGVHDVTGVYDIFPTTLSETETKILKFLQKQPNNLAAVLSALGYNSRVRNIRDALSNLLKQGLTSYTIPDKPRSKKQQYIITAKGVRFLKKH